MVQVLLIIFVYPALAAVLFAGSRFLQGVFYETLAKGLWWRALIGAGIIWTVGLVLPSLFNLSGGARWPVNFDDMLFLRTPETAAITFQELRVIDEETGREIRYRRTVIGGSTVQFRDDQNRPMPQTPPVVIAVPDEGEAVRWEVVRDKDGYIDRSQGTAYYQNSEGQRIPETAFYTGLEAQSGYGQFFLTLFGDVVLFAAWFLTLWLVMQFQWPHALLIALPCFFTWGLAMNLVV
ncbi:MAG: hypothetical protein NZM31_02415 [Gemmatales bacterium]|nr:hypothetical protein [Gemmatales bacterium]MDW8385852.1 hypothetical protein [Gemmatales bacterium]